MGKKHLVLNDRPNPPEWAMTKATDMWIKITDAKAGRSADSEVVALARILQVQRADDISWMRICRGTALCDAMVDIVSESVMMNDAALCALIYAQNKVREIYNRLEKEALADEEKTRKE